MRKVWIVAACLALGVAIALLWRRDDKARDEPRATTTPQTQPSRPTTEPRSPAPPPLDASAQAALRVRKLSREARAELGRQIATARAKARAARATSADTQPATDELFLEQVAGSVQKSFLEALPLLAECYPDRGKGWRAAARMTLTSDPELGTVIDTELIKDGNDKPVDPALDTCLRDVIDSLGMPPLGDVGGTLKIEYTFRDD